MNSVEEEFIDPEIEAAIEALSVPTSEGTDLILERANTAYLEQMALAYPQGAKIQPRGIYVPFAFSYSDTYGMKVTNPETEQGFDGKINVAPAASGEEFDVSGSMAFFGREDGCELAGRGVLEDDELVLFFDVLNAGIELSFEARLGPDFPDGGWLPAGTIQCQQAPDEPGLNGDIQLTPEDKKDAKTTYTIIKVPRKDAQGRPVTTGNGANKKQVFDSYFWRGGKWWKIKDPALRVRGSKDLIDLRDGTGNPNYEPADDKTSSTLDRVFFPTGWQDFWKGFNEASARQLQGLSVTLSAMTGTDLSTWQKIRRLRNQGKSWAEIWDACWFDILLIVGLAVLSTLPLAVFLRRIFGPMLGRLKNRLFTLPRPGTTPHPPLPAGRTKQFADWLLEQFAALTRRRRELTGQLNDLFRRARLSSHGQRQLNRQRPRLQREINRLSNDIERMERVLRRMGLRD